MAWTTDQKIAIALRLPWTVVSETSPEGDRLLRAVELPAAIATGTTDEELADDYWQSLEATIAAYLEFGDPLPRPTHWQGPFPWELVNSRVVVSVRVANGSLQVATQWAAPALTVPTLQQVELAAA